jgi:cytochrome c biogenesis protein CcdA
MKKKFIPILILFVLAINLASAQLDVHYFYGTGCPHCANVVESGILELVENENVTVTKHEIYHDLENAQLFSDYCDKLGLSRYERGVPMAVIECKDEEKLLYLLGDTPIINKLQETVENCEADMEPSDGLSPTNPSHEQITIWTIIVGALIDSINPCAFAVLAFLLIGLLAVGSRKRMLKIGTVYIIAVYITYFLTGLGLFKAIQSLTKVTHYIYLASGIIVLIAGLIEIKDFFWYRGLGISLEIPMSLRPYMHKLAEKGTLPAAIIMGFLVSLFELPCTGGIYLAILTMMSMNKTFALGYLLIYNLIFILPLIVITLIVYKGANPEKLDKWRQKERKWMKIGAGIILIALGLYILLF